MNANTPHDETPIIFLAMFWGGGGPYTIAQIVHVYDWVNRDIVSREDLEKALNVLLQLGLVTREGDGFRIPRERGMDFETFRKKRRKSKFQTARKYFESFDLTAEVPRVVELSKESYDLELKKYRESF